MWQSSMVVAVACLCLSQVASAQVYKWKDANGVTHYGAQPPNQESATQVKSPTPGATQPAQRVEPGSAGTPTSIGAPPLAAPHASARTAAPTQRAPVQSRASASPGGSPTASERERAIAKCQANRGARCEDPNEVRQWVQQDRPITAEQQRAAVAARNERNQRAQLERARQDAILRNSRSYR